MDQAESSKNRGSERGSPEDSWDRASFISKPHTFLNHQGRLARSSNAWNCKATLFFQEHNTAFGLSTPTECALRRWGWLGGRQSRRHRVPPSVWGLFRPLTVTTSSPHLCELGTVSFRCTRMHFRCTVDFPKEAPNCSQRKTKIIFYPF